MSITTRGFRGRGRSDDVRTPPGQYLTDDFPVLSAGPTPRISRGEWTFRVRTEVGAVHDWTWDRLTALPNEDITVDIHCVTRWSKLATRWRGCRSTRSSPTSRPPRTTR